MYRLIYKSRSVAPLDWTVVKAVTSSSESNNQAQGVTGLLIASRTHFLQVLEGKFEAVNATFRRISRDPRHEDISLIAFSVIDARLFGGWGMKGIGAFDFNQPLESSLQEKYGVEDDGIRLPLEEWQVLAMIQDIKMIKDLPDWKR